MLGAVLALAPAAGCEGSGAPVVDAGVARRLVAIDPPGAQIGLRYGKTVDLLVRYETDEAQPVAIRGEEVRFAIFDDPAGSTLARDEVTSNDDGVAAVTLTAGNQEGAFRVHASAAGAADVELAISISELEFVEIDAQLADPLSGPGARTLVAALFTDRACASLPATAKPAIASRSLSKPGASATLAFVNLLSRGYAVVGRVEEAGRLVAYGCVEVARALVPPGARVSPPITLRPVRADVTGAFDLTTALATARASRADGLFAPIDVLDRCAGHLGQLLLDELAARVPGPRAAQIAALRGPPAASTSGSSTVACRPDKVGAADSLDAELGALLAVAATPGAARAGLLADLDGILMGATLRSRLVLARTIAPLSAGPASPDALTATHEAEAVAFALGGAAYTADLAALGTPVRAAAGVDARADGSMLTIDEHALPIGLPSLWGLAFGALSIGVRLPALPQPTLGAWTTAAAAAAQRNAKAGCAAIEDLVCERTDPTGCAGTLLAACGASVTAVGTALDAPFASPLALRLLGRAAILDDDGDLVADRLAQGSFTASGALPALLSFTGQRGTP